MLAAYYERPGMRGIERVFGVAPANAGGLVKKTRRRAPPSRLPCCRHERAISWNWRRWGALSGRGNRSAGCGMRCVAGRDRVSPLPLGSAVNRPAAHCGDVFLGRIDAVGV
jgi:hypothetical protein